MRPLRIDACPPPSSWAYLNARKHATNEGTQQNGNTISEVNNNVKVIMQSLLCNSKSRALPGYQTVQSEGNNGYELLSATPVQMGGVTGGMERPVRRFTLSTWGEWETLETRWRKFRCPVIILQLDTSGGAQGWWWPALTFMCSTEEPWLLFGPRKRTSESSCCSDSAFFLFIYLFFGGTGAYHFVQKVAVIGTWMRHSHLDVLLCVARYMSNFILCLMCEWRFCVVFFW